MEEAQRIAVRERARFLGRDDVVGNGGATGGARRPRTKRTKGKEPRHGAQKLYFRGPLPAARRCPTVPRGGCERPRVGRRAPRRTPRPRDRRGCTASIRC